MEVLAVEAGQELNVLTSRIPRWTGWLATIALNENGDHIGVDGTSKSLSNEADLKLLISLRGLADIFVTTGLTARTENYRSSRLGPIAFITRNPESLKSIQAFSEPGAFTNLVFSGLDEGSLFQEIQDKLKSSGYAAFLYEGGPSLLPNLLEQIRSFQLVLSITNLEDTGLLEPQHYLKRLLPEPFSSQLLDDFAIESNRVTRWLISQ